MNIILNDIKYLNIDNVSFYKKRIFYNIDNFVILIQRATEKG